MSSTTSGGGRTRTTDPSLHDIVLVDQLPSDAWAEGIIVRPSGTILTTRIDADELFSIAPPSSSSKTADSADIVPKVIHKFPTRCVVNICRLKSKSGGSKEEYAVLTSHVDFNAEEYHSTIVWRITFEDGESDTPASVTKIAELPDAVFCLGMEQVTDDVLLVIDTAKACIWRVSIAGGDVGVFFSDEATMRPKSEEEMFGANRLRLVGGYMYYTNTSTGALHRVATKVSSDDVVVTGSAQTIVPRGLDYADGLVVTKDGRTAYVASYVEGMLWRIDVDVEAGTGLVTTLMDELIMPTAMDLVYQEEKPTLYVVCCGAVTQNLMDVMGNVGFGYAGVEKSRLKLEVTITTEVVVTYEAAGAADVSI